MGNDPIYNVDEDGGWSAGLTGALIGAVGGGVTGFMIADKKGASTLGAIGAALGGAVIGAGLGYATGETFFSKVGSKGYGSSFFKNLEGFYRGLINSNGPNPGGGFTLTTRSGAWGTIPKIWGGGNGFSLTINIWKTTQTIYLVNRQLASRNPGKQVTETNFQRNRGNGTIYNMDRFIQTDKGNVDVPQEDKNTRIRVRGNGAKTGRSRNGNKLTVTTTSESLAGNTNSGGLGWQGEYKHKIKVKIQRKKAIKIF